MGKPRKPTEHLKLIGAFDKDPQRERKDEPVCTESIGPVPDRLTGTEIEAWNYLVGSVEKVPGVLTRMDRAYLQLCAKGLAAVWDYDDEKPISQHMLKSTGDMLSKLGMTPVDRSRVVVPKDPGGNGGQRRTR